jgi:hypothetical protein
MPLTKIKSTGLSNTVTTSAITEGANLYFSNARVVSALTHSDVAKLIISPFLLAGV